MNHLDEERPSVAAAAVAEDVAAAEDEAEAAEVMGADMAYIDRLVHEVENDGEEDDDSDESSEGDNNSWVWYLNELELSDEELEHSDEDTSLKIMELSTIATTQMWHRDMTEGDLSEESKALLCSGDQARKRKTSMTGPLR